MSTVVLEKESFQEASGYKTEVVDDKKEIPRAASKSDDFASALSWKLGIGGTLIVSSICTSMYAMAVGSSTWALVSIGLFLGFVAYSIKQFMNLFDSFRS